MCLHCWGPTALLSDHPNPPKPCSLGCYGCVHVQTARYVTDVSNDGLATTSLKLTNVGVCRRVGLVGCSEEFFSMA